MLVGDVQRRVRAWFITCTQNLLQVCITHCSIPKKFTHCSLPIRRLLATT
jgi:hypothetical protein